MPSFLTIFTFVSITTQTTFSIIFSWMTLDCQFQPHYEELQEVTITKLLYLYDPEACGRVYFYNFTLVMKESVATTSVEWPVHNEIATAFRQKVKVWVSLHTLWFVFCVAYMTQGHRPCGFYTTLLPFTLTGVMILFTDILYLSLFLCDTPFTSTEKDVLDYINSDNRSLYHINKTNRNNPFGKLITTPKVIQDTSWISLFFAYVSCRGVVLWVFNFWMIEDNYFEGLSIFRQCQSAAEKEAKLKSSNSNISVETASQV